MATLAPGTRVRAQASLVDDENDTGTVIGPTEGLPGFVDVAWDIAGVTYDEQIEDLDVIEDSDND